MKERCEEGMNALGKLRIKRPSEAQMTMDGLYQNLSRRLAAAPKGNCPVELTAAFEKLCLAQSCGKCVPCRVGLDRLTALLDKVLDGKATQEDVQSDLKVQSWYWMGFVHSAMTMKRISKTDAAPQSLTQFPACRVVLPMWISPVILLWSERVGKRMPCGLSAVRIPSPLFAV